MAKREIETADTGPARTAAAMRSLASFGKCETIRLASERRLFRQAIQETTDPRQLAKLRQALGENEIEQASFDAGWAGSSLRRRAANPPKTGTDSRPQAGQIETRIIAGTESRITPGLSSRVTGTSKGLKTATMISGYTAKFNKLSHDLGGFREKILPFAFASALRTSDITCNFNHDINLVYGRSSANTLEIKEDSVGLWFQCYLLKFDPASYSLARRIARRDVAGCSFRFTVEKDSWEFAQNPGELDVRTIQQIGQLYDCGPVLWPAYPDTTVQASFEFVERSEPGTFEKSERQLSGPGAISDSRTQAAYDRLAAFDEREEDRDIEADRQRRYVQAGLLIARNARQIAEKKRRGAMPISYERQQRINADYFYLSEKYAS